MSKLLGYVKLKSILLCIASFGGHVVAAEQNDGFYQRLVLRENHLQTTQTYLINANARLANTGDHFKQSVGDPVFASGRVKTSIQPYAENSDFLLLMVGPE